jgi:fructose transport system substrate-binding protein
MASLGVEAIAAFAADGTKPKPTEGKAFFDTGVALITDKPARASNRSTRQGALELCWG